MTYAQLFCAINDLLIDPTPPAGSVDLLYKEIAAASQTILQEIGNFIPISETRKLQGSGGVRLFIPPLLTRNHRIVRWRKTVCAVRRYGLPLPGSAYWRH